MNEPSWSKYVDIGGPSPLWRPLPQPEPEHAAIGFTAVQNIAGLGDEVRDVDLRHWVGAFHHEHRARRSSRQRPAGA